MYPHPKERKRVAIVGAGAAGMSATYALSLSPDNFEVTLFERAGNCGGMATSTPIDASKYGAPYINDGVQGGSPVFHNTFGMFYRLGFRGSKVGFQISFGKEPGVDFWSNVFPSDVIDQYQSDIRRFGRALKIIKALEPIFGLMSVSAMLSLFRFSKGFGDVIVFPLVALFMGTGNQTPFVSAAIVERLFLDPNMALFEFSPDSFLAEIPEMRAFPELGKVYEAWQVEVKKRGNVKIELKQEIVGVDRAYKWKDVHGKKREGVKLIVQACEGVGLDQLVKGPGETREETFDELIMACDADSVLKALGKDASWMERKVLGNVKYLWDVTVTHNDLAYMDKYYRLRYDDELASKKRQDAKAKESFNFAASNFRPLYYIRSYPSDKKKIEMSFDLTQYQPQFKGESPYGPSALEDFGSQRNAEPSSPQSYHAPAPGSEAHTGRTLAPSETPPLASHVFQTIFLDRDGSQHLWSKDEVQADTVILEKWWKQQSHRWQHYAGTVPWMMFLNGRRHTHFAGAWTVLNMHEIAVVSGFAAAYRLGAKYPFAESEECQRMFRLYLAASHGVRMRKEDRKGVWA